MIKYFRFFILIVIYSLVSISAFSQKMSIESFELAERDLAANTSPTMKFDLNGEKCAIIKIQTVERGFLFDVGTLGVVEVVEQNSEHPGEIWLYVPNGVKNITIQHPVLGSINNYDLGQNVKEGKVYILKLTSDQVNTLVIDYENRQYLRVKANPKNAEFLINGIPQQLNANGICEIPLPFGTHTYRVIAENYHMEEGRITINDRNNKQELNINLKQAFGYLTVNGDVDSKGADVFIDNIKIGQIPINQFPVKSGRHSILITQKLYKPYNENFTITDGASVKITPAFSPNYAIVNLYTTDKEAQIYDNGRLLGVEKWNGKLEKGEHIIEVKKKNHITTKRNIVVQNERRESYHLESPKPIYGILEVSSSPLGAEVLMDGKVIGKTPLVNRNVLIGQHSIELRLQGHKKAAKGVTILENKVERINMRLTDFCTATITSSPNAYLRINGGEAIRTPHKLNVESGKYKISLFAKGYSAYSKSMQLDGNTKDIYIKLRKNYIRKNEFYIQAGYNVYALSGISMGLGFYCGNFNLEANYIMGLSESENIYWNHSYVDNYPYMTTYKPSAIHAKIGYGIRLSRRLRFTPQIGCQVVNLKELGHTIADGAKAVSGTMGGRFNLAISSCIGISVSPEYIVGVNKTKGYKALSDISPQIKGYSEGFGCNASINLFF